MANIYIFTWMQKFFFIFETINLHMWSKFISLMKRTERQAVKLDRFVFFFIKRTNIEAQTIHIRNGMLKVDEMMQANRWPYKIQNTEHYANNNVKCEQLKRTKYTSAHACRHKLENLISSVLQIKKIRSWLKAVKRDSYMWSFCSTHTNIN